MVVSLAQRLLDSAQVGGDTTEVNYTYIGGINFGISYYFIFSHFFFDLHVLSMSS